MSESTIVACPQCATKLKLRGDVVGRKARCPKCATAFRIGQATKRTGDGPSAPPAQHSTGSPANKSGSASRKNAARTSSSARRRDATAQPKRARRQVADPAEVDDFDDGHSSGYDDFGGVFDEDLSSGGFDDGYQAWTPETLPTRKRKKKTKSPATEPEESHSIQDTVHAWGFAGWILCGSAAGLIGVFLTTLMGYVDAYFLIGLMALVTGSMVGAAIRFAASPTQGWAPGLTSLGIALAAIMLGKIGAFYVWTGEVLDNDWTMADEMADSTSESSLIAGYADEVEQEWLASGKITEAQIDQFFEQNDADYEDGGTYDYSMDYLPEVWQEATNRWNAVPDEEQATRLEEIRQEIREDWIGDDVDAQDGSDQQLSDEVEEDIHQFKLWLATVAACVNIFLPLHSLFFFCSGIFGAFRLASNLAVDDDE